MDFCKSIIEEDNSKTLVITVDNGVSALKEIEFLKDNNIEVIVLDHHEPQKTLPNCCIVNPVVYNDKQKYFSGCAVVFNTIKAYKQKYKNNINLEKYLPYTAFSLIADMMDMSLENQIYIKEGLKLMKNNSFFKLYKDYLNRALNPKIISWKVAPVINATGRVSHINEAACLMYETDEEEMLNQFNVIQKIYEDSKNTKKEALSYIKKLEHTDDKIMFIDGQNYAKGIYSILAGQGTDYFKKPCVVYDGSKEETSGSCRSIEGLDIKEILTKEVEKGNMISVGGHEQACGVSFKLNKIEDIIKSINKELDYVFIDKTPISDKEIKTYDVGIKDINKNLYYCIHSLAYDKYNFTEPIFSVKGKLMSFKSSKNNPLNIELTIIDKEGNSKSFWWWGGKEFFNPEDYINKEICLLGNIDIDFMNRITLSIIGGKGI